MMTTSPRPSHAQSGPDTLSDFIVVAKKTQAKSRPLPLRPKARPSSDMEFAHRGALWRASWCAACRATSVLQLYHVFPQILCHTNTSTHLPL